jgi:TIGR03009 family protein
MRRIVRTLLAPGLASLAGIPAFAQQMPGAGAARPPSQAAPRKSASPGAATATPRPAAGAAAVKAKAEGDPRKLDEVLRAWEAQSQRTTSLRASFIRVDLDLAWNTKTYYAGTAVLRGPNLAYLDTQKYGEDNKTKTFFERIVCTGNRVYHFQADTRQVHIYDLAEEDQAKAMEEGPLPFLFNMKAEQAKARYRMAVLGDTDAEWLIQILPIKDVDREGFSKALIRLDRSTFLPTEIVLFDPSNGKDTKTYRFTTKDKQSTVSRNAQVGAEWFDGADQAKKVRAAGWDLVMHGPDGKPAGGPAAKGARVAAPAREPVGTGTVRALPRPAQRPSQAPRR